MACVALMVVLDPWFRIAARLWHPKGAQVRSAAPAGKDSAPYRGRRRALPSDFGRLRFVALVAALGVLIIVVFGINAASRARGSASGANSALNERGAYSKPPGYVNPLGSAG